MGCRINRRRLWVHRMMLEALVHPTASFVTLTYSDENIPDGGTLVPKHLQLFLKRLRARMPGHSIRYFAVGEYGDQTLRPHYHAALFGIDPFEHCPETDRAWAFGHTMSGDLTFESASYIAGYVTKKLTKKDDPRLPYGHHPEFARMSLRPGIGAGAISKVAQALQSKAGWDEIGRTGDVPALLRHGAKTLPLGRYLRRKLREEMNFENTSAPKEVIYQQTIEMCDLLKTHLLLEPGGSLRSALKEANAQKILNVETRSKIFQARKKL